MLVFWEKLILFVIKPTTSYKTPHFSLQIFLGAKGNAK